MSEAISGVGAAISPGCRCAHPGYETISYETTQKRRPVRGRLFRVIL